MKILVIEDSGKHAMAAAMQLEEQHEVDYALSPASAMAAFDAATAQAKPFEVVLCDLMLWSDSPKTLGPNRVGAGEYVLKEEALGWPLALIAVQHGAKYVGVLSDMNHHDGPHAACLEEIHGGKMRPEFDMNGVSRPQFIINGA